MASGAVPVYLIQLEGVRFHADHPSRHRRIEAHTRRIALSR
jgi:hypothetical protein